MALSGSNRTSLLRLARRFLIAALIVLLLPYGLTPFYRIMQPVSTPMLWRWMTGQRVVHANVTLDTLPRVLPLTVIAAEDARFCAHHGIDWESLRQVLFDRDDSDEMRGASTLTQQLAKNLFLWSGRSYLRKALEFPLALWIDLVLPKRRIMELYLNVAEWGPQGEFGIEAGAQRAFGKSARELTAHEAALLAAVLPNPVVRNAGRPRASVRRIAGIHQRRAASSGGLDACLGRGRRDS